MQIDIFDPEAPKKATNLSINSDLLKKAREHKINLSRTLERSLAEMLLEAKRREWKEENNDAIDEYNRRVEKGVFSDELRRF